MKSRICGETKDIVLLKYLCLGLLALWPIFSKRISLFTIGTSTGGKSFFFFFAHSLHVSSSWRRVHHSLAVTAAHKACLEPYQTC